MWLRLVSKRSLHTGNQIDSWTIFSGAATRSHMKMYTSENQTYKKR